MGGSARETKTKPAVAERLLSLRVQALSIRSSAVILPLPCSLSLSLSRSLFRRLLTFGFSGGIKQENPRKKQAGGSSSLPLILLIRAPADTEEPMVMVKEKGSMALHSTGWGPGERAHAEGENQASMWEICVRVGCREDSLLL